MRYEFNIFQNGKSIKEYSVDNFDDAKKIFIKYYWDDNFYCQFLLDGKWIHTENAKNFFKFNISDTRSFYKRKQDSIYKYE